MMSRLTRVTTRMTAILFLAVVLSGCDLRPPMPPPLSGIGIIEVCDGGIGMYLGESDPGVEVRWAGGPFYIGGGAYSTTTTGNTVYVKPENPGTESDYSTCFTYSATRSGKTSDGIWRITVRIPPVQITPVVGGDTVVAFSLHNRGTSAKPIKKIYFQVMTDDGSYHFPESRLEGISLAPGETLVHNWPDFGYRNSQIVAVWPYSVVFDDETTWGYVFHYWDGMWANFFD